MTEGGLRITVAQIGARRHYAIPAVLHQAGLLDRLHTDLCADIGALRLAGRMVPARLQPAWLKRLLARRVDGVPRDKIRCYPRFALARVWGRRRSSDPAALLGHYRRANCEFGRLVARRGLGRADAVYVFNGAGLEILRHARQAGMKTILDQTMAPVAVEETLLAEERQRWHGWEHQGARPEDWAPLAQREEEEWQLADVILCGSEYVRSSIRMVSGPSARCHVVPHPVNVEQFRRAGRPQGDHPLRVLFVGTVCLRKGIPYLLEAAKRLKSEPVVFRVVGPIGLASPAVEALRAAVELIGPVPRSSVVEQYQWADVFVMPSISEGSANVCYEAMAAGLPVITTASAGSVVRDAREGFIVPIRSADALAERVLQLRSDRELREELSRSAAARASEFTLDRYRERLIAAITAAN
jgi:glycosyltransferase involved in cell wall biosynthesis